MEFPAKKLHINGIEMNVIDVGAASNGKAPVLLVHGFPDTHAVWREQIPALVAAGYRVIAPDTRGCGESELMPSVADYRMEHLIADLVALLDVLAIPKVKLVAHDWGSFISWRFVIAHPERVERYVALSVGHPNAYSGGGLAQKLKGWYIWMFQLRGIAEWLITLGNWTLFSLLAGFPEERSHWRRILGRPGRLTAGINYYRANLQLILARNYPHLQVPVTGIYSDGDRFLTEGQMTNSARYCDAGFRFHLVRGANHWLQLHQPALVTPLILDALK